MLHSLPPIARSLIIVNVLMFAGGLLFGNSLMLPLALWPIQAGSFTAGFPSFQPC